MSKQNLSKGNGKRQRILFPILLGVLFTVSAALFSVSTWYKATFDISFNDLLSTILSPLQGTGENTIGQIVTACVPPVLLFLTLYIIAAILVQGSSRTKMLLRRLGAGFCALSFVVSIVYSAFAFRIPAYLHYLFTPTEFYEREYIDPDTVAITDKDSNARNLIYIYLESMENTYASVEEGGYQEANYMPNLTALAKENTSFSHSDALGGFRSVNGTGWTIGALMGTTSGVPFSLSVYGKNSHNSVGRNGEFANGLVTLGDILAEKGYNQEFLCGSDAKFGGRSTYVTVHGNYKIFDYYSAIEKGYIPRDRYVFWGLEDAILFQIAKDELIALASEDKPFNFTMLTVDPHHVGGYRCSLCGNEYPESHLACTILCQDRLLTEFIEWCKTQDFYENTTIVIVGDHPRMDKFLISETLTATDRTMYNCIIGGTCEAQNTTNRVYTALDLFPTVLSAMGFEIEGERLGLGVNLYSDLPTLCERYGDGLAGYHYLDTELSKPSDYYKKHFVRNK